MKIEVLGGGCKNCEVLAERTKEAVAASGIDAEVEKVTDMEKIMGYGIMSTPALAIDGEVKSTGKVLSVEEISALL